MPDTTPPIQPTTPQPPVSNPSGPNKLVLVLIVVLVIILLGSGYYFWAKAKKPKEATPTSVTTTSVPFSSSSANIETRPKVTPTYAAGAYTVVSVDKKSPKGTYEIKLDAASSGEVTTVIYTGSQVTTPDVVAKNEKAIGFGTNFACPCTARFTGWINDDTFVLKIVNVDKSTFEYKVDAKTGVLDPGSLRKTS